MTYTGTLVRDLQSVVEACLQRYGCREWAMAKRGQTEERATHRSLNEQSLGAGTGFATSIRR